MVKILSPTLQLHKIYFFKIPQDRKKFLEKRARKSQNISFDREGDGIPRESPQVWTEMGSIFGDNFKAFHQTNETRCTSFFFLEDEKFCLY